MRIRSLIGAVLLLALCATLSATFDQRTDIMGGDVADVQALPELTRSKSNQYQMSTTAAAGATYVITSGTGSAVPACYSAPFGATVISRTF